MRYIKETPQSGGIPYKREEITEAEAAAQIGAARLQQLAEEAAAQAPFFPGVAVMAETDSGIYVGAQA